MQTLLANKTPEVDFSFKHLICLILHRNHRPVEGKQKPLMEVYSKQENTSTETNCPAVELYQTWFLFLFFFSKGDLGTLPISAVSKNISTSVHKRYNITNMIPQTARDSQGNSDKRFRRADWPLKVSLRIQTMWLCYTADLCGVHLVAEKSDCTQYLVYK